MKGYLHNLLMRSMGVAETVQPRLASLFEPPVTTALTLERQPYAPVAEPVQDRYEDESSASPSSSEAERPAPLSVQRAHLREDALSSTPVAYDAPPSFESERPSSTRIAVEKPQPVPLDTNRAAASQERHGTVLPPILSTPAPQREPQTRHDEGQPATQRETFVESSNPQPSLPAQLSRLAHAPLPAETIRVPERTTLAHSLQSTAEARETSPAAYEKEEPRAASQPEAMIERVRSAVEETKTIIRKVSERTFERELLIERSQVVLRDEHSTIRDGTPERPAPLPLRPRVSQRAEERRTLPDETQGERTPEPVIHVSIGRIEVRAVRKEARPQQQRTAARPAESLEDYLRQRAKGGGR